MMQEITFKEFQTVMSKRNRNVDDLVDLFRGKIEEPREFFDRVMSCQWRNPETRRHEDRSAVVIPYRSVLEFYFKEKSYLADSEQAQKAQKRKLNLSPEQRAKLRERMKRIRESGKLGHGHSKIGGSDH